MNTIEKLYIFFGVLSVTVLVSFFVFWLAVYRKKERSKYATPIIVFLAAGVFFATLLVFVPIYYCNYNIGVKYNYILPFLLSVHNSMRVFILDGEFDTIINSVKGFSTPVHIAYSFYCAALYVIAPILTFSTVLSFFKNFRAEIRYKLCRKRPVYIMSDLNEQSVALAKSICKELANKRPIVVFTDVFENVEEKSYELLLEARNLNAICLKKDVSHLNIIEKKGNVEVFLIGANESENVSQAAVITKELNKNLQKQNIKIFVFAVSKGSSYTIDSLRYDNLLAEASKLDYCDNSFKIRRVNYIRQLVWSVVPEMDLLNKSKNGVISVMIAGMGSYGVEFLKTLVWFCQVEGYSLELNVFDKLQGVGKEHNIQSLLSRQCPELIEKNPCHQYGDADYDIRFFEGIDFYTDGFASLFRGDTQDAQRLRRTTAVIVALGDDDDNIETAVYLRNFFDRVNIAKARAEKVDYIPKVSCEDEIPAIYSIVYDGVKAGVVQEGDCEYLINYKKMPFHIHFVGSIAQQFSYNNIYNFALEQSAYRYHIEWSMVNKKASEEMRSRGISEAEIQSSGFVFCIDKPQEEKKKYEQFEYFRMSSISKALHKEMLEKSHLRESIICLNGNHDNYSQLCECDNCRRRKRIEHNRWNAYMRSEGYMYSGIHDNSSRADRALLHNDLCNWDELTAYEKAKD